MQVSSETISAIASLVTGNNKDLSPTYASGPVLVDFFNQFGLKKSYGAGFPSRWKFAEDCLVECNAAGNLAKVIEEVLSPRRYMKAPSLQAKAADFLNLNLKFDDYEVFGTNTKVGMKYRIRKLGADEVPVESTALPILSLPYIKEQIDKCDAKIAASDFEGAITNARTLTEAVLIELETKVSGKKLSYDGNLQKLYKRVQKLLNLAPDRQDIDESLRTLLGGLSAIIAGLAPLRNNMSDAHPATYRPARHHAKLVVNSVKTLVDFLFETYEYQLKRGVLIPSISSQQSKKQQPAVNVKG